MSVCVRVSLHGLEGVRVCGCVCGLSKNVLVVARCDEGHKTGHSPPPKHDQGRRRATLVEEGSLRSQ